jgi:SAM-dependent methyltransferase
VSDRAADRARTLEFYEELADKEWDRLTADLRGRVSLEVHRRFLARFVKSGDEVLEIGAGPGRFTLALGDLGATVDVTDLSPAQLSLNARHVAEGGGEFAVRSRGLLDVCDTSRIPDATYDAVVAFGGPLSYAFEDVDAAMSGLLRVLRPDGVVVASVMSLLGSWRFFMDAVLQEATEIGEDVNAAIFETGDLRPSGAPHVCQMFRSRDVIALVNRCGGAIVAMSASNFGSLAVSPMLESIESDAVRWANFLSNEVSACAEPGALDAGTHLLFAATRSHG